MPRTTMLLMRSLCVGIALLALTHRGLALDEFGCARCCRMCGHKSCTVGPETVKEKQHCWCIEPKEVCIPSVRFPWTKCNEFRCGRVRTVRVLKIQEYECERCGYQWTIHDACASHQRAR